MEDENPDRAQFVHLALIDFFDEMLANRINHKRQSRKRCDRVASSIDRVHRCLRLLAKAAHAE